MMIETKEGFSSVNPTDIRAINYLGNERYSIIYKDGHKDEITKCKEDLVQLFDKECNPLAKMQKPLEEMLKMMKESNEKGYTPPEIPGFYCEKCDKKVMETDVTVKVIEPTEEPEGEEGPRMLHPRHLPFEEDFICMECKGVVVELATRRHRARGLYE